MAAFLGNQTATPPRIANIPLNDTREAAYAAYVNSGKTLARILVVNLNAYNSTVDGIGEVALPPAELEPRPSKNFTFTVPDGNLRPGSAVGLRRLLANGSDAISGITFDGWSYNYELAHGRPVRLANVTVGETVTVDAQGAVTVAVQDSSAVILDFDLR